MAIDGPQHTRELQRLQAACNDIERMFEQANTLGKDRWKLPELTVRAELLTKAMGQVPGVAISSQRRMWASRWCNSIM